MVEVWVPGAISWEKDVEVEVEVEVERPGLGRGTPPSEEKEDSWWWMLLVVILPVLMGEGDVVVVLVSAVELREGWRRSKRRSFFSKPPVARCVAEVVVGLLEPGEGKATARTMWLCCRVCRVSPVWVSQILLCGLSAMFKIRRAALGSNSLRILAAA